jgi:putative DNA primase/helicase
MSTKNVIYDFTREQREPTLEPVFDQCGRCSHDATNNGNIENITVGPSITSNVPPTSILEMSEVIRPCYMTHIAWFRINNRNLEPGLYFHGLAKSENDAEADERISSPIIVEAITSNSDGNFFGRLLRFIDCHGVWHCWPMPMSLLKSSGDELLGELLDQGLTYNRKKRNDLINYIMNFKPTRHILAASTVGWHNDVFVLPNQVIGGSDIIFQSTTAADSDFQASGTIEGWQNDIGRLCRGNIPLMVSVAAALAGPVLKLINRHQGGGIHWVGDSSSGKSTCIEVAASIWGSSSFIRSWCATANGLEGLATTRNDTCLILDEIDEASPLEIGKITYMLANGQGKQRAGVYGNARSIQRWRTIAISTGERSLTSIMSDVQKQPNSGQLVRMLNINSMFEHGVFSNLHDFENGRTLSDHLKTARLHNYGVIGPAFIACLREDMQNMSEYLADINKLFAAYTTNNLESRAAAVFAVIALAGELGIHYKLLPWSPDDVINATLVAFKRWRIYEISGCTEDQRILESIRNFIDRNSDSRFSDIHSNIGDKIHNRAGWYKNNDEGNRIYMLLGCALEEAGGKYGRNRIVEALKKASWLTECDSGRKTKKTRIAGENKNLYYLCIKEHQDEL